MNNSSANADSVAVDTEAAELQSPESQSPEWHNADTQATDTDEQAVVVRAKDQIHRPKLIELRQQVGNRNDSANGDSGAPKQQDLPFAIVQGETLTEIPSDLYIPPAALEVFLDAFEGPLDLLLYLIKRQNLDILEIDVAELTEQYMQYVRLMDSMQFELAA